ncbi:MAG: hypothetical protein ACQEWU_05055 [Bacillota bacterium]|uniref:hypothetical protein n=1 Tax=Virgibacillus sp. AGTR TaxID=2812055 RepID=UPI001D160894|nr:hypothetical protein [Virgibacillus sp. AGTR]MCC2249108.1 hypothetical protein [Virgibacillus sp. AGTR]
MTDPNQLHLQLLQKRFDDILSNYPEIRKQRAELLQKDMEMLFSLPNEKVHSGIANLYEKVKETAR